MKRILRKLNNSKNDSFIKNILSLLTGTTIAQLLPLLITPILTRIYTPEEFGLLGLYLSCVSVLSVIITGRYDKAIVLPKEKEDAIDLLKLSFYLALLISCISVLILIIFKNNFSILLNKKEFISYLILIPFSAYIIGITNIFTQWNSRQKNFNLIAVNRVAQSANLSGAQLILGFTKININGLIIGQIFGQMISGIRIAFLSIRKDKINLLNINIKNSLRLAKVYKDFPLYSTLSSFLNTLSLQLPILLMSGYFTAGAIGYYVLANRFVSMPMNMLGASVSQVYFQEAARLYENDQEKLKALTFKTFKNLSYIGTIPMLIVLGFGDIIFSVFFGSEWSEAGQYARMLSPWILFVFISSPLTSLFYIFKKQKLFLMIDLSVFVIRLIAFLIGAHYFKSELISVFLFAISGFVSWFLITIYTLKLVNVSIKNTIIHSIIFILIPFILILLIRYYLLGSF